MVATGEEEDDQDDPEEDEDDDLLEDDEDAETLDPPTESELQGDDLLSSMYQLRNGGKFFGSKGRRVLVINSIHD